jgi:butyrate kinase
MAKIVKQSGLISDRRLDSVSDLVEIAGRLKASSVAVPGGHRAEDLQLVESARDHGIVDRIVLVGDKKLISRSVYDVGIEIPDRDIIPADSDEDIAAATVGLIREGLVDIVLKGGISTPVINRNMLQTAVRSTVSLATIFDASPIADSRPMILTDAGMTTVCNFGRLVGIIENAIEVARVVMGLQRPKVAVLSANEKQIASLPSTLMGKKLAEKNWDEATVCGPLSFDLATDPGSVAVKGVPDIPAAQKVAGQADILVCPGIDAANILYKTITAMTKFGQASLSGITVGFQVPYVILSRADTLDTRLNSIALCSIYSQRAAASKLKIRSPKEEKTSSYTVLTIKPCVRSLCVALYENNERIHGGEIQYSDQYDRRGEIREIEDLAVRTVELVKSWSENRIDACAANADPITYKGPEIPEGTYIVAEKKSGGIAVDERLVSALSGPKEKDYGKPFAAPVVAALAGRLGVSAFITLCSSAELLSPARVSGYARIVLGGRLRSPGTMAAAERASRVLGRPPDDVNFVVADIGEDITIAAVEKGRIVDISASILGEGPFSPCGAGSLPAVELIELCYSGDIGKEELMAEVTQKGGLCSYLRESRIGVIEDKIAEGDARARCILEAMGYQIVKEIGGMYGAFNGAVEAIVLTGELMRSRTVRDLIRSRINALSPVIVLEGSLEMEAAAKRAVRVLSGKETPLHYEMK